MDMISLSGLRTAIETGGLRSLGVAAAGGLFFVTAQTRGGEWISLATTRGQARGFKDAGKAIILLHAMGAQKISVDVSRWEPARAAVEGVRRPDVAARQRRVHGMAAKVAKLGDDVKA